jgi:hypothetical protein
VAERYGLAMQAAAMLGVLDLLPQRAARAA